MPQGPGKYDDLCTQVREQAEAVGAVVIVIDGKLGSGFSMQAPEEFTLHLPTMLEWMAQQIRQSHN